MKRVTLLGLSVLLALCMAAFAGCGASEKTPEGAYDDQTLKAQFLEKADRVVVNDTSVTFTDASGETSVTVNKNPKKVANLYASFTTLWYEAGGTVAGCIGGSSSVELYTEQIGRDITKDEGVEVLATTSSGSKWSTETIIATQPDLIICSTAMSGYDKISSPAKAANIPVIAVSYNDFSDYLKWFKVFCNLTGQPQLWDSVALKALDDVVSILMQAPLENNPRVFSMFIGSKTIEANTSLTVVGGMLSQLRAINIVDEWENKTGADRLDMNLETVFAAQPAMILAQCHSDVDICKDMVAAQYSGDAVWNSLDAVKNDKVYYLQKTLFHNKPNSKFAEAYKILAETLYPDVTFGV